MKMFYMMRHDFVMYFKREPDLREENMLFMNYIRYMRDLEPVVWLYKK